MRWQLLAPLAGLASLSDAVGVPGINEGPTIYDCAVCRDVARGVSCSYFESCDRINDKVVENGCAAFCHRPLLKSSARKSAPLPDTKRFSWNGTDIELRVARGMAKRGYDSIRVTALTYKDDALPAWLPKEVSHSEKFQFRWTDWTLHTGLMSVPSGGSVQLATPERTVEVKVPKQGDGVLGFLMGDPCVHSGSWVSDIACEYAEKFDLMTNLPLLMNAFAGDPDVDLWGILGDNFYDRVGQITPAVWSKLSLDVKRKPFMTIPGNHDFWINGGPVISTAWDTCGTSFVQWHGQDVEASLAAEEPYQLIDPSRGHALYKCNLQPMSNFVFYHQTGNLGVIGQSGAHTWDEALPFVQEACKWMHAQESVKVLLLLGHWDNDHLGVQNSMDMPSFYHAVRQVEGCDAFDKVGMMKYYMGHTHCNSPHPEGDVNAGFRVAGFGMEGCGNYGAPLIDTTGGRVRALYFDTSDADKQAATFACVADKGVRACMAEHAEVWLDQPIVERKSAATAAAEVVV